MVTVAPFSVIPTFRHSCAPSRRVKGNGRTIVAIFALRASAQRSSFVAEEFRAASEVPAAPIETEA
jgi:hypothetical protein